MRFSYLTVGVAICGALACATGEDLGGKSTLPLIDAGHVDTPIDQSGGAAGSEPVGSGGMMMMESGGTMPVGMGGMPPAAGGAATGGKASGGAASGGRSTGGMAGASTGGKGGTGGSGSGGKATGGGGMSSGGADPGDGGNCPSGQKFCGGLCTPPAPRVGCDLTDCSPCTIMAPQNGYVTCANNQCAWDCLSGYTKNADKCEGMGTGGNTGSCRATSCPACNVVRDRKSTRLNSSHNA